MLSAKRPLLRGAISPLILLILLALLGIAVFIGSRVIQQRTQTKSQAGEAVPTIKILPETITGSPGDTVTFNIFIDTVGSSIVGADVELSYDPASLTITEDGITAGTIFPQYLGGLPGGVRLDATTGTISMSGLAPAGDSNPPTFSGEAGLFATITATVQAPGTVEIAFTEGSTDDSNLTEVGTGNDILAQVKNATVVGGGRASEVAADFGRALQFSKGNNYIFFPSNLGEIQTAPLHVREQYKLMDPKGPTTVELWLRFDEPVGTDGYYLFYKQYPYTDPDAGRVLSASYYLQFRDGRFTIFIRDTEKHVAGSAVGNLPNPSAFVGSWHHLAGVYDGEGVRLYIDGVEVGRGTVSLTAPGANVEILPLLLPGGTSYGSTTQSPAMTIDELRVSKVARYTSDFRVPTTPLANDNDTLHLWRFNAQEDDPLDLSSFLVIDEGGLNAKGAVIGSGTQFVDSTIGVFVPTPMPTPSPSPTPQPERFTPESVSVREGWNLLPVTFVTPTRPREVCDASAAIEVILTWDAVGQRYQSYECAAPAGFLTEFPFEAWQSYWVRSQSSATVTFQKSDRSSGSMLDAVVGWNLKSISLIDHGLPAGDMLRFYREASALQCNQLFQWDVLGQRYKEFNQEAYDVNPGFSENFALDAAQGFFVRCLTTGQAGSAASAPPMPDDAMTTPPDNIPTVIPGDYNGDGVVNTLDVSLMYANWGRNPQRADADLNSDSRVNSVDYGILLQNYSRE